tara:strand:+ start:913 stop:2832 length:1920 start_codon:yes stop_codon:yes gene_type:complete
MLQAGGIDKLVEQKADAYRGNPQALQKRYSQNQELMDLLAMQKLKTEKEAASRDMQLKAEQTPSTIAEQYEQQLVGMNKDEMAGQVAGVLGQKQKQAQQKQQAMGMPPQKPQGQRPPMPQGAPQGIASQPRPNMQGMAQGGIIGYAAGDKVEAKGSRLEQALKAIGVSYEDYMAMRPEQKKGLDAQIQQEYVKQRKDFKAPQMPISAAIDKAMVPTDERVASDAAAKANYDKKQSMGATGLDALLADDELLAEEADQVAKATDAANAVNVATGQTIGQPPAGQAPAGGVGGVNQNLARVGLDVAGLSATPDTSGISKKQVTDALAGTGVTEGLKKDIAKDPAKVQQDELTRMSGADKSKGGLDRAGQEATYNKYLKEKEDLDKELLDPARLKRERANAGIRGLIEGGTSRGASIAKGKFDENTVASRQASITQRLGIEQKRMDNDVKIATEINAEAGRAMGRVMDERQKAMATVANITADDIAMYNAEADRMYESNQNGIKNKIDALKADTDAKLNELVQRQASASEIASQISSLHDKSTALREEFFKSINPQLTILREKEASEGLTSDEQGQMEKYESQFQQLVEKTEISEAIKVLNSFLIQIRDQGGYSLQNTSSNAPPPPALPTGVAVKAQSYIKP